MVTSKQLRKIADIAEKYGRGEVHCSVRQCVELLYIPWDDFGPVIEELKEAGLKVASCGPRFRVPTACGGCTYNPNGLTDTLKMCKEADKRHFGWETRHHKFKVAFSGCPIDCTRTREMDLGFQGIVRPALIEEKCNGCGLCVQTCEENALRMEEELPIRDWGKCIGCGDCIKICPRETMVTEKVGWLARAGGKHGKHPLVAKEIATFLSDEEVFALIESVFNWYRKNGEGRERIGHTIRRLGWDKFKKEAVKPVVKTHGEIL